MADRRDNNDISREEKLNLINQELILLHHQAKQSKNMNVFKAESNFLAENKIHSKKMQYISFIAKFSIFIGIISCLIYCDPLVRYVRASSRKLTIKVIPLWDWRWLHGIQCFVENPLKDVDQEPDIEICNKCSNLTEIDRLNNSGVTLVEKITTSYLNNDIPVIVVNVSGSRPITEVLTVEKLRQLYLEDEVMRLFMCCDFESNIPVKQGNHRLLLKMLADENITQYYAHWQNCFKEAAKLFRKVFKRPDFLPPTVELAHSNWVFLSSNFSPEKSKYIHLPVEDEFIMLKQLEGHMDATLEPNEVCQNVCPTMKIRLNQGSALILTDVLYHMKYLPSTDEESITVGVGGTIDL